MHRSDDAFSRAYVGLGGRKAVEADCAADEAQERAYERLSWQERGGAAPQAEPVAALSVPRMTGR